MLILRSLLVVPAIRGRPMLRRETARPDAIVLDLEGSVPTADKRAAREAARAILFEEELAVDRTLFVRVNGLSSGLIGDDIQAVVGPRLAGLILPKVEQAAELREANRLLAMAEAQAAVEVGSTRLVPVIETVSGVVQAAELAESSPRILALSFGYEDFTLDLGVMRTSAGTETLYPRARIAISARAAGVLAIDGPLTEFGDRDSQEAECRVSRQLGFTGKLCIHRSQIELVNRVFSPSPAEVERARAIIGDCESVEGQSQSHARPARTMIDRRRVERARRIIELDDAIRQVQR